MISGSTRYARSLGFVGGLGDETPGLHTPERIIGVNFTGKPGWAEEGGQVWAKLAPTTLIAIILGSGIAVATGHGKSNMFGRSMAGALIGAVVAVGSRTAAGWGL